MTNTPRWNFDSDAFSYVPDTHQIMDDAIRRMNAIEEEIQFEGVRLWFLDHGYKVEKL